MENLKKTENCRKKQKIPAAQRGIGCRKIENILKTAEKS